VTVLGLGHGQYVADTTVYMILYKKGREHDMLCSETKPSKEEIGRLKGTLREIKDIPKIILDDGQTVYGCQVIWEPTPHEN
jgi:hypothetical protein